MAIDFYGYDNCDTCRKAKKWLDSKGIKYRSIPIVDQPPSKAMLSKILKSGEYELKHLLNTSGQLYRQMKIKGKLATMSQAEAVALLAENGKLCKRPIVTDGSRHTVGFHPEVFAAVWGG